MGINTSTIDTNTPIIYDMQGISLAANKTFAKTGESILFTGNYLPNTDLNIFYWVNRTISPHEHIITVRTDCNGNFKCIGILSSDIHNEQDQPITQTSALRFQACPVGIYPFECYGSTVSNEVKITISPGTPLGSGSSPGSPGTYAKNYPKNSTYSGSAVRESIHSEFFRYFSVEDATPISQERQMFNVLMAIETSFVQQKKILLNITVNYSEDLLHYFYDIVYEYINSISVKISPSADTYVTNQHSLFEDWSNTNYGTSPNIDIGIESVLGLGTMYWDILMRFPISSEGIIPPGSMINTAKLYMPCVSCQDVCALWQIRNNPVDKRTWEEDGTSAGVTWNNRPTAGDFNYPGTKFPTGDVSDTSKGADITCYISDMYNQGIDADFTIGFGDYICIGYGGITSFGSTRNTDSTKRSYIEIEYSPKIMSMVLPAIPMSYIVLGVIVIIALALIVWTITEFVEFVKSPAGGLLAGGIGIVLIAGTGIYLLSRIAKAVPKIKAEAPKYIEAAKKGVSKLIS